MSTAHARLPKRVPLHREIAEILTERIVSGEIGVNSLLPPERELCERMGVSRTVVREAIKLLESRGLVRIDRGRGTLVTEAHTSSLVDSLKLLLRRRSNVLRELLEIRQILEVAIAGLAAERRSEANLRAMDRALSVMRSTPDQPAGYVDADVEFHFEIARAAKNPLVLALLEPLSDLLRESRIQSFSGPRFVCIRTRQHEEILDYIRARDAEGARRAMGKHLKDVNKDLKRRKS